MIRVEQHNDVRGISLHRPERRNALSYALLAELEDALLVTPTDSLSAVIIRGDDGVFSAGADLSELTGTSEDTAIDDAIAAVVAAIQRVSVPVIAWVDGPCVGGAVDLMLACDIRIASTRAWFQIPATRLGLLYNPAAVARMRGMLSRETLSRLLLHGERFGAGQALAAGLVTHAAVAVDSDDAGAPTDRQAKPNVEAAVAATSELLDAIDSDDFKADEWEQRRRELLDSPERAAAIAAANAGEKN
ncbi:MAG: enoyl-CoA hydratase/isomerase family protein [Woeseiaceae bacterium]